MKEGINLNQDQKPKGHLDFSIEGVKPIIVCTGTPNDFSGSPAEFPYPGDNFNLKNIQEIDWFNGHIQTRDQQLLNAGAKTYVISPLDSSNKLSKEFYSCTGLVVAGITPTGEKISFLTHQQAKSILIYQKKEFNQHLKERLTEIKEKCLPGTIDAIIIGGDYSREGEFVDPGFQERYLESIKSVGQEVLDIIGFEPTVANGSKILDVMKNDDVYYDNKNRRLYFVRPEVNEDFRDFKPSEADQHKNNWQDN